MSRLRIIAGTRRGARENLSITEALCRGRRADTSPDTLRFQHFPRAAIIGRHQILGAEIDLDWCAINGVETARRMTGGGAIVMGPGILGWELVIGRERVPQSLADIAALICNGLADGLKVFGIEAAYRPRNDVEVGGRKISGTGGYLDGPALVYQGTVLVDLDIDFMTSALKLPAAKLGKRGLETFAERVCDLKGLLGQAPSLHEVEQAVATGLTQALAMQPEWADLTTAELAEATTIFDTEIGTDAFVEGADVALPQAGLAGSATRTTPGGTLMATIRLKPGRDAIVDQVLISGDFFVTPPRVIADLEAHLRQRTLADLGTVAAAFLAGSGATFLGASAADALAVLEEAAGQIAPADASP